MVKRIIQSHIKRYPKADIQDILKLIYQNEFAGGHLIKDPPASLNAILDELNSFSGDPEHEAFVSVGNMLDRADLFALDRLGLSMKTLNSFFVYTANTYKGDLSSYKEKLDIFGEISCSGELAFPCEDVRSAIAAHSSAGYPAVSHSQKYKEEYRPSYRIVEHTLSHFLDLFLRIDDLLSGAKDSIIVCIDGRSTSGKTTLGKLLKNIYDCNIFHADDFFLQTHQRSEDRLADPGGNLDRERLKAEVFEGILSRKDFQYRKYDCKEQRLSEPVIVPVKRLNVIEGAYSTHPELAVMCDLKVFLNIDPALQKERINSRNHSMYDRFITEWIPLEERYIEKMDIAKRSDLLFEAYPSHRKEEF